MISFPGMLCTSQLTHMEDLKLFSLCTDTADQTLNRGYNFISSSFVTIVVISDIPSLKTLTYPTRKMTGTTALSAIQLLYRPHIGIVNTVNGNTGLYYLTISFSQPQLQMLLISMLTCPNPGTRRSTLQKHIVIIHYLTLQNHMKRLLIYVAMSCSEGISCSLPCLPKYSLIP